MNLFSLIKELELFSSLVSHLNTLWYHQLDLWVLRVGAHIFNNKAKWVKVQTAMFLEIAMK